ncbi:Flagellar motor switch protein FliN [hydrothermal vent metagenome]|uniref:Flagellar motor switch protein FliN n=1 Tax=hydrothermal vent metagenome TaxID=652676 RepID=A0A3B1C2K9_9ZZZZ
MADDELSTENEEDLWAAAAEDLAQQKDMLRKASGGEGGGEADSSPSPAPDSETPDDGEDEAEEASVPVSSEVERILDIPLQVSVELGRTKMLINDLLQLGQGSVIELSKLVGEPLEILVNEKLVAKGEVVVINEKFGVRLTEIITPQERIESMT